MDDSLANSKSLVNSSSISQDLGTSRSTPNNDQQGMPPGLVAAEERRRQSLESSTSVGTEMEFQRPSSKSPILNDNQSNEPIETLEQQNRALKCELETYKLKVRSLQEDNKCLRQASVTIQAKAEQEEEFISNTLLKKIQTLKKEKESLAINYEQEEECLTNDLTRKLDQLRQEKVHLEHTLEQEQECLVNKLMRRIEKLETETTSKQISLEKLRREKVELENTLEQEQEALVNKLWKRMDQLEKEKRSLQVKLDKPVSEPQSPRSINDFNYGGGTAANLANNIRSLRRECARLKQELISGKEEHERKMAEYAREEKEIKDENLRLQRRLQLEMERREALCRHLSESESSIEMEEERAYNEMSFSAPGTSSASSVSSLPSGAVSFHRTRNVSGSNLPLSQALNFGERELNRCGEPISSLMHGTNVGVAGFTHTTSGIRHHTVGPSPSPSPPLPESTLIAQSFHPGNTSNFGATAAYKQPTIFARPATSYQMSTSTSMQTQSNIAAKNVGSTTVRDDQVLNKLPASMDTNDSDVSVSSKKERNCAKTPSTPVIRSSTPNLSPLNLEPMPDNSKPSNVQGINTNEEFLPKK